MKVNIAELNRNPGQRLPFSFSTTAEELEIRSGEYAFDGLIQIVGTVVYTGSCWRVTGTIEAVKTFVCDRCLTECRNAQSQPFSEDFAREADDEEEVNVFEGDMIDIRTLVRNTLIASQPLSNICKPDCKGLCPVCGHNLNEGDCGCDRFVPDPRMAALQQLLNKK